MNPPKAPSTQTSLQKSALSAQEKINAVDIDMVWTLAKRTHPCFINQRLSLKNKAKEWVRETFLPLPHAQKADILVVTETLNDMRAVEPTITSLRASGTSVSMWGDEQLKNAATCWIESQKRRKLRKAIARIQGNTVVTQGERLWKEESAVYVGEAIHALRTSQAKVLFLSNDHSTFPAHAIVAARMEGIPSVYTQHAPVGVFMPPLGMDMACLDGWESFAMYRKCSEKYSPHRAEVFLTGKKDTPQRSAGTKIGVAVNALDTPEDVHRFLLQEGVEGEQVLLRTHPSFRGKEEEAWLAYARKIGAQHSNPVQESPESFIQQIQTLYAGTTGIFLQAAMAGVACKQWQEPEGVPDDYYGFQRSGLISTHDQAPKVADASILKAWSETWDTPLKGQEGHLVAHILQAWARGERQPPESIGFYKNTLKNGWTVWSLGPPENEPI